MKGINNLILAAIAAVAALSGCAKDKLSEQNLSSGASESGSRITFTAERAADDGDVTRTVISTADMTAINWSADDAISVFDAEGHNYEFTIESGSGTPSAQFSGIVEKPSGTYLALYPYQKDAFIEGDIGDDSVIAADLKREQTAVAGSFDPEAALMVARSDEGGDILQFRNVLGFVKLTPKSDCSKITFIPSEGIASGPVCIAFDLIKHVIPQINGSERWESISIVGDIKAGESYYIAMEPNTYYGGFTLIFTDAEGNTSFKRTDKTFEVKRSGVLDLGEVEGVPEPSLKFTADDEQSFSFDGDCSKFQYSVAYGAWEDLTSDAVTFGGYDGDLRLRGKSETGTWDATAGKGTISFGKEDVPIRCSGDIRTLIDWENYETVNTGSAVFRSLFENCKVLLTAPDLPSTVLGRNSYRYMFQGCVSLSSCPDLPAESAPAYAYQSMFDGCSSITAMPEIAATSIGDECMKRMFAECVKLQTSTDLKVVEFIKDAVPAEYSMYYCQEMFLNCTSLKTAPALPAENLGQRCYTYMFKGCTNLEKAPALPARELVFWCYRLMFEGCTSLVEAPVLTIDSADEGESCKCMFDGCSSLKSMTIDIKDLPNDGHGRNQFDSWLEGTAADGVLHIRKGLNAFTKENLCCPKNWTFAEDITD